MTLQLFAPRLGVLQRKSWASCFPLRCFVCTQFFYGPLIQFSFMHLSMRKKGFGQGCFLLQADRRALNITLNSIGTELTRDDRRKLYSNFGLLYPHGHSELALAEDFDQIRQCVEKCPPYQVQNCDSLKNAEPGIGKGW